MPDSDNKSSAKGASDAAPSATSFIVFDPIPGDGDELPRLEDNIDSDPDQLQKVGWRRSWLGWA